jgi:hypothetical protein
VRLKLIILVCKLNPVKSEEQSISLDLGTMYLLKEHRKRKNGCGGLIL